MGLDVSHDCWHGAYSAFMRWRRKLAEVAGYGDIYSYYEFGGEKPWPDNDPLITLLKHSDCDGTINWQDCMSIAKRLEDLLPALKTAGDGGGHIGMYADKTQQFINGLIEAGEAQEDVEFH